MELKEIKKILSKVGKPEMVDLTASISFKMNGITQSQWDFLANSYDMVRSLIDIIEEGGEPELTIETVYQFIGERLLNWKTNGNGLYKYNDVYYYLDYDAITIKHSNFAYHFDPVNINKQCEMIKGAFLKKFPKAKIRLAYENSWWACTIDNKYSVTELFEPNEVLIKSIYYYLQENLKNG